MRAAEEAAFAGGVQVEALMNKAGAGVAHAVTKFFKRPGRCIVFAGKGHNAGDALFAAQCLELTAGKPKCASLSMKRIAAISHARSLNDFFAGGRLNSGRRSIENCEYRP